MLSLSRPCGQLIGTLPSFNQLYDYIVKNQAFLTTTRSIFHSINPVRTHDCELWRFTHYTHDQLCILYAVYPKEKISSEGLRALESGQGLLEIMYGDTNILSQFRIRLEDNIQDSLADWCTRYCIAHDLIVTVKPDTGDDDDFLV